MDVSQMGQAIGFSGAPYMVLPRLRKGKRRALDASPLHRPAPLASKRRIAPDADQRALHPPANHPIARAQRGAVQLLDTTAPKRDCTETGHLRSPPGSTRCVRRVGLVGPPVVTTHENGAKRA